MLVRKGVSPKRRFEEVIQILLNCVNENGREREEGQKEGRGDFIAISMSRIGKVRKPTNQPTSRGLIQRRYSSISIHPVSCLLTVSHKYHIPLEPLFKPTSLYTGERSSPMALWLFLCLYHGVKPSTSNPGSRLYSREDGTRR